MICSLLTVHSRNLPVTLMCTPQISLPTGTWCEKRRGLGSGPSPFSRCFCTSHQPPVAHIWFLYELIHTPTSLHSRFISRVSGQSVLSSPGTHKPAQPRSSRGRRRLLASRWQQAGRPCLAPQPLGGQLRGFSEHFSGVLEGLQWWPTPHPSVNISSLPPHPCVPGSPPKQSTCSKILISGSASREIQARMSSTSYN